MYQSAPYDGDSHLFWASEEKVAVPIARRHTIRVPSTTRVNPRLQLGHGETYLFLETHVNDLPQRQKFSGAAAD